MKSIYKWLRKEKGDIALIAVFASMVFVLLMALLIDGGLMYYQSSKLQNAVDATTLAVSHNINDDDDAIRANAEKYLKANGFDPADYGAPGEPQRSEDNSRLLFTYGDREMVIAVEKKGVLTEEAAAANEDAYISAGYLRLTVGVKNKGNLSAFTGLGSVNLVKSGYAKCNMNYTKMPHALNYTIFGNSSNKVADKNTQFEDMTVQIVGRSRDIQAISNTFSALINGINEKFVQPILGIFGVNTNYGRLVSASTSHAITNGDVHSNSDINVGVNTLQASRTKDTDYTGQDRCICTGSACSSKNEAQNRGCPVCTNDYKSCGRECSCSSKCTSTSKDAYCIQCNQDISRCCGDIPNELDYNQVTYTAHDQIVFSNTKQAEASVVANLPLFNRVDQNANTKVYVQNQMYLEDTQLALQVINQIDFSTVGSTSQLRTAYENTANRKFATKADVALAQKNNLEYLGPNRYRLNNQKSIVYNVTNNRANAVLDKITAGTTLSSLAGAARASMDSAAKTGDYDSLSVEKYNVEFTKQTGNSKVELVVSDVTVVNRDIYYKGGKVIGDGNTLSDQSTQAGYEHAIANTFRQYSDYIEIPNMKPYFVRTINRSVKNATTSKDSSTDSFTDDSASVKQAAMMSIQEVTRVLNGEKTLMQQNGKSKGSDAYDINSYKDDTYATSESVRNKNTTPLFRHWLSTNDSNNTDSNKNPNSMVYQTFGNDDERHTKFRGESLFKAASNGESYLKTPAEFIQEFSQSNGTKYGNNAVDKFKSDNIDGKYGSSKVSSAKNEFRTTKSYAAFNNTLNTTGFSTNTASGKQFYEAPVESDVFLSPSLDVSISNSIAANALDSKINTDLSTFTEYDMSSSAGIPKTPVTIAAPTRPGNAQFNTKIKVGSRQYVMKELMYPSNGGASTVGTAISTYLSDNPMDSPSNYSWKGTKNVDSEGDNQWRYNLQDGYIYNRVNQIQKWNGKMGFYLVPNATARVNGVYLANVAKQGNRGIEIGENSRLFIQNDSYPNGDYHEADGIRYVYYNVDNAAWINVYDGGKLYIKGHAWNKGDINMSPNSLLYVEGNLTVNDGKTLNVGAGSTVIVTGQLDCSSIRADASSTIYCGSLNNGNDSGVEVGNLIVAGSASTRKMTIKEGANVIVGGSINTNGKEFVVGNNAKVMVQGNISYGSISLPAAYGLYVGDSGFTYFNQPSNNITVSSGSSIGVKSFSCSNLTVSGELFVPSSGSFSLSSSGTLTNNGVCRIDKTISGNSLTNSGGAQLQVTGDIRFNSISNDGIIVCSGAVDCTSSGTINQTSNANSFIDAASINTGALYLQAGKIYVSTGNVTADTINFGNCTMYIANGDLIVNNVNVYNGANIYVGSDFTVLDTIVLQDCNIKVIGVLSVGSFQIETYASPRVDYGSFGASVVTIGAGAKVWMTGGSFETTGIENNGTLYIKNDIRIRYLVNNAGAQLICKGNLTLCGSNPNLGHTTESLTNYGSIYVNASITAQHTVLNSGGMLYVKNDINGAVSESNSVVLLVDNAYNNIYIGGWITSNANGVIRVNSSAASSVLSIYGFDHQKCIDSSKVVSFENNATGCTVYLGTGTAMQSLEQSRRVTITNNFINNGKVFVYGNLELRGVTTLSGTSSSNSKTVVAYSIMADGNTINAGASQNAKHILRAYSGITVKTLNVYGSSEVYGIRSLNITDNVFKISDDGVVFCGPETSVTNYGTITVQTRDGASYSGTLYYPGDSNVYTLSIPTTFNGGRFITDSGVIFNASIAMRSNSSTGQKSLVYVGGTAKLSSYNFNNDAGELYLMGTVELTSSAPQFKFNTGCTNYIGPVNISGATGTISYTAAFNCGGNNYIENNVIANTDNSNPNKDSTKMAGERWTSIFISDGATHISGNLTIPNKQRGTRINAGGTLSCTEFSTYSTIYDYGNFVITGNINIITQDNNSEYADNAYNADQTRGNCIKVGENDYSAAMMFIGGNREVTLRGCLLNYGKFYAKGNYTINGDYITGTKELQIRTIPGNNITGDRSTTRNASHYSDYAPHISIRTGPDSKTHFGAAVSTRATIYTGVNSEFSVEGNLGYGQSILNGGKFYVKGNIVYSSNCHQIYHIEVWWVTTETAISQTGEQKGAVSIVNGFVNDKTYGNEEALFFCGGRLETGESEHADVKKISGSVVNFGSMYVNSNLNVYSNKEHALDIVAIICYERSKTFVNGDCFSSGGAITMADSIFMCQGNFFAKRCVRICAPLSITGDSNLAQGGYFYCGGDMLSSTAGRTSSGDIAIPGSTWNYMIVYSNTNVYVGGVCFTNSVFVAKRNVTFVIDGLDTTRGTTYSDFMNSFVGFINSAGLTLQNVDKSKIKFVVVGDSTVSGFDDNGNNGQLYRFYIHGSAYVEETFRFRDMCQAYIYGDFINLSTNTSKNVEIGKSLTSDSADETWAKTPAFRTKGDSDKKYSYANATYFYVQDNFETRGRLSTYAGTTLKVGGNCFVRNKIQMSHNSNIFVGGDLRSSWSFIDGREYCKIFARGNIDAANYIVVAEHSFLYSGGDHINANTSIEGKSYCTIFSRGDIKAKASNIKIRDGSNVFCAGNMTAQRYIELGKYDEKYKDTEFKCTCEKRCTENDYDHSCYLCTLSPDNCEVGGEELCTCTKVCTEGDKDTTCPVCSENYLECVDKTECVCSEQCFESGANEDCALCSSDFHKCKVITPCTCTERCTEKNDDCELCKKDYTQCDVATANGCTCVSNCSSGHVDQNCPVCKSDYSKCEIVLNELGDDETDKALGGNFYIGKSLVSKGSYIKEFGFSKVIVGKYVYARDYITLRSNSDMWALPEVFENETYKKVVKTFESDGTLLGDIIASIQDAAYRVQQALTPKNGSIYSMGELTLNKNASLMGTWDCYCFDQCLLAHDALAYFGHDFKCYASSIKIDFDKSTPLVGFAGKGAVYSTIKCTNKKAHPKGYTLYSTRSDLASGVHRCDKCNKVLDSGTVREYVTCPVVIYANNEIDVITSVDMRLTYLVACNGDTNIMDAYSNSDNISDNFKQLPNAVTSYNSNINYQAIYGKICALFYAPKGDIKLDGFYQEIWGSCIGDRVTSKTFYTNFHRFTNWRTMDLQIAESGNTYLVSQREFEEAENNVEDDFMYTTSTADEAAGGASMFFDRSIIEAATSHRTGTGVSGDNSAL